MQKKSLWVIKAGSQMVCQGGPLLLRTWMQQVNELQSIHDIQVIWVTSGAIATANEKRSAPQQKLSRPRTSKKSRPRSLDEKQALSAIGQPIVMDLYNLALNANGLSGAQVLLTADDIRHRLRKRNLQNTLTRLLEWNVVPILNENDAVATEEIQFGDNDSLSSKIAVMMGAKKLVLLTDVNGLYDRNPKTDRHANLIHFKDTVTAKDIQAVKAAGQSARGTGGMYSKLLAAQTALKSGIVTHLLRGDENHCLTRLAQGELIGTQIGGTLRTTLGEPRKKKAKRNSQKR